MTNLEGLIETVAKLERRISELETTVDDQGYRIEQMEMDNSLEERVQDLERGDPL